MDRRLNLALRAAGITPSAHPMSTAQEACPKCADGKAFHAGLHTGHIWTDTQCPAYRTLNGDDCTCVARYEASQR